MALAAAHAADRQESDPGLSRSWPEVTARHGDKPALISDLETLTYRALAARANRYARWALAQGLRKGEVVCLLMPNRPEYLAIWLGITRAGGAVALLNTNLTGHRSRTASTWSRPST